MQGTVIQCRTVQICIAHLSNAICPLQKCIVHSANMQICIVQLSNAICPLHQAAFECNSVPCSQCIEAVCNVHRIALYNVYNVQCAWQCLTWIAMQKLTVCCTCKCSFSWFCQLQHTACNAVGRSKIASMVMIKMQ